MEELKKYAIKLDIPISAEAGRGCFGTVYQSKINGAPPLLRTIMFLVFNFSSSCC